MNGIFMFLMFVLSGTMVKQSLVNGEDVYVATFTVLAVVFLTLSVYVMWSDWPERWRHKARGSTYSIVDAQGIVQTSTPLVDYDIVVIYRDEKTGRHYVRLPSEFMDGRFEKL